MAAISADFPSSRISSGISSGTGAGAGPGDRLTFALFLVAALHAALILGITFTHVTNEPATHVMEVTLAQRQDNDRPDEADFIAQSDQAGSGTLDQKALITTTGATGFTDTRAMRASPATQGKPAKPLMERNQALVVATSSTDRTAPDGEADDPVEAEHMPAADGTLMARALEIANLEARLDSQRQVYARRPRVKRLTSLSTASRADAFYLNSWRRKIESVGNLNYPEEARRRKIYGSLRLMVAVLPDGSLKEIELLESSGHPVLDDAARRIVTLAAPFAPFPDELRKTTDVLEIIRTWQFRKNSSLGSY